VYHVFAGMNRGQQMVSQQERPSGRKPRIRQVPAVSRAIAILRLLGGSPEPMSLKVIGTSLSLVPSTCLHILRVLVAERLVDVDGEFKRYTLSSGILSLARGAIVRGGFASLAQPALDRLSQAWGITAMGVEIENEDSVILLAIAVSQMPFALLSYVGTRHAALASATGRLVAAYGNQSPRELKQRFKPVQWAKPLEFDAWKREVELARKKGYSVDRGFHASGITIVAVPILTRAGRLTHTLSGAAPSEQLNSARIVELAESMRHEAKLLSTLLI